MKKKLQVFVSSTFTDLKSDRQAAVQAILKAGHIPAGMELFTASDKSQWETIKRWINESDVYMLILGGRYGSVDPATNISYTEMEYDYAIAQSKPLFSVVIDETALEERVKSTGSSVLEKDNPAALKRFREKVLKTMSAFFADERDVRLAVHETLGDFRDNDDLKGWVSGAEVEDTSSLLVQIAQLQSENKKLSAEAKLNASSPRKETGSTVHFNELEIVLKNTLIKVPAEATKDKDFSTDLLTLLDIYSDDLINGLTPGGGVGMRHFLYNTVFPKLMVHRLAANEKPSGSSFRRSYLTDEGKAFLAYLQHKKFAKDASAT